MLSNAGAAWQALQGTEGRLGTASALPTAVWPAAVPPACVLHDRPHPPGSRPGGLSRASRPTCRCSCPRSSAPQEPGTFHVRTTILPPEEDMEHVADKFSEFHRVGGLPIGRDAWREGGRHTSRRQSPAAFSRKCSVVNAGVPGRQQCSGSLCFEGPGWPIAAVKCKPRVDPGKPRSCHAACLPVPCLQGFMRRYKGENGSS